MDETELPILQTIPHKKIVIFWTQTTCSDVDWYGRCGGTYCFHFQGWKNLV